MGLDVVDEGPKSRRAKVHLAGQVRCRGRVGVPGCEGLQGERQHVQTGQRGAKAHLGLVREDGAQRASVRRSQQGVHQQQRRDARGVHVVLVLAFAPARRPLRRPPALAALLRRLLGRRLAGLRVTRVLVVRGAGRDGLRQQALLQQREDGRAHVGVPPAVDHDVGHAAEPVQQVLAQHGREDAVLRGRRVVDVVVVAARREARGAPLALALAVAAAAAGLAGGLG